MSLRELFLAMRTTLKRTLVFLATICAVASLSTAPASASTVGSSTFTSGAVGEIVWTNVPLVGLRLSGAFTDGFTNPDPDVYTIVITIDGQSCVTEMDGVTISPPEVEAFTIPTQCSIDAPGGLRVSATNANMAIYQNGQSYATAAINQF
ncbi:hypothetical protein ABZX92_41430 [Lentzea sp. NPDC006480]|uniref:hypothetical protein n=1 Tax=Lentzea sp. NPDC006480 TaxID=3157176 RepID=UPI0033AA35A2